MCFPGTKQILYAVAKIQKHEDIIKVEPDFINYSLTDLLNKGNCINSIEPIRDFNGFSWSPVSSDSEDYYSNLIYQDLNILCDNKLIEEWIDNNNDMIDYMDLFRKKKKKRYGKKFQKEILELLKTISILMEISNNKKYKDEIYNRKKKVENELEAMKNKTKYLEDISKYKRKLNDKIGKVDIILNDKEKLKKEYEKRNKDLPLEQKIFSKKVLKKILSKEREEYLLELKNCNDKMNSKKFIKYKKECEYELEYLKLVECKEVEKEIFERVILLQKRTLQAIKLRIKNAINREEINRIIYEIRYFNLLPIDEKTKIGETAKLNKMLTTTKVDVIAKAYELKSLNDIYKDKTKNINILKYIFNLKIIKLEDIGFKIIKDKDDYYIQFYDDDVTDEKVKLDIEIKKEDLKIRINKKIKLFDL